VVVTFARGSEAKAVRVWTVGHGSRSTEQLLNMLKESKVDTVADIRRWPTSKLDRFKRENLEQWLREAGIDYVWMGETLGGYRKGGYENYMRTESFKRGLEDLLKLASKKRVCLLCLEPNPRGCHRRFISRALHQEGIEVAHILR